MIGPTSGGRGLALCHVMGRVPDVAIDLTHPPLNPAIVKHLELWLILVLNDSIHDGLRSLQVLVRHIVFVDQLLLEVLTNLLNLVLSHTRGHPAKQKLVYIAIPDVGHIPAIPEQVILAEAGAHQSHDTAWLAPGYCVLLPPCG